MFFTTNPNEFETAFYFSIKGNRKTKQAIGVERVGVREKRYNTIMQALSVDDTSTVLKTSYSYNFEQGNEIKYRDNYYIITKITLDGNSLNPQALAFSNAEDNAMRFLSIMEVQ